MSKPKVLIFIDWFTPGYKAGGPVSSNANMIAHLKDSFHFKVVTRNTEYMESTPYSNIEANKWLQMDGFEGYYIDKENLNAKILKRLIQETDYDVAYVNGIYSWYFSILPLILLKRNKKKVIVSARGMLSEHAFQIKGTKKKLFLTIAKLTGLYKNIIFHATNAEESKAISLATGIKNNILVAPNLPVRIDVVYANKVKQPRCLRLVYIARIAPEKNNLFALQILSMIANKSIHIDFDLYGPVYNQEYKAQCEEVKKNLPSNIKASLKGPLERQNTIPKLQEYHFLFMPSTGENYGHAIVEAMLAGCPVIISDRTPWRNLDQRTEDRRLMAEDGISNPEYRNPGVGWDISLEQPERFVEVIEYCARIGQEEYDTISQRAFEYAKRVTEDPEVIEANKRLFL